ncbi:hypothetical protein SAMN05444581_101109 [Methylocapsa palsarum]|uniref:Uncharacterized protein n=1 Tax=Methylocapsa palsarum TaxID=1612308 RepID=A0A1I3VUG9_9HYPH|nr:hypothetical protein SAMN05444581_101109 [Methylocapsa palsarum]
MKRFALLLALIPFQANAYTIFEGPDVPVSLNAGDDFPHFDVDALCKAAWPSAADGGAGMSVCQQHQNRLAGLISNKWTALQPPAKRNCARRAEDARYARYSVLYACVNKELFAQQNRQKVEQISNRIRTQNGVAGIDRQPVGSVR